jgi:nucleoside-diphosphate-sugar epimerase
MRVVITGATGNVGTSLVRALAADDRVREIVGISRRPAGWDAEKTSWVRADIASDPLEGVFRGADAVVHLAWAIQPSRDLAELERVNVEGSRRVFAAAAAAGVGALVYASSIGAYSPGPKDRGVDESWPTGGIPSSFYSRHKAASEEILDSIEAANPDLRVVRLRPGLIFKAEAATEIRRLFAGPFLPSPLVHPRFLKVVPTMPRLRAQAVHCDDVAEAYRLVVVDDRARGAYNIAAEPVIDPDALAAELGAVKVPVPPRVMRVLLELTWKARLQPTPPGWLDMGLGVPLMDTRRAREELGWTPRYTALEALRELLDGMSRGADGRTPPLSRRSGGPGRLRELLTGIGGRNP